MERGRGRLHSCVGGPVPLKLSFLISSDSWVKSLMCFYCKAHTFCRLVKRVAQTNLGGSLTPIADKMSLLSVKSVDSIPQPLPVAE